jgi:hypothetical protein
VVAILLLRGQREYERRIFRQENATGPDIALSYRSQATKPESQEMGGRIIMHLAMTLFEGEGLGPAAGLWFFLSVSSVALFAVFIPLASWIDSRRKEREAYYRSETLRRVAESSGEGSKATLELLWEENRQKQMQMREGLKVAGLVNIAVGLALMPFLKMLLPGDAVFLCGMIPLLIGVAMLVYVYVLAAPVVDRRG